MNTGWFDSHCHLYDCDGKPDDVIARARAVGVHELLVAGIDARSSERALSLASNSGVYAAVGVHPNESASWDRSSAQLVDELADRPEAVAVGETGLDFYREASPPTRQLEAFRAHIAVAQARSKALVIHTRDSVEAALEELAGSAGPPPASVFHCWSGDERQLERALDLGAYVSFAGNITFPRNAYLRRLAARVPEERLLVETDSPYLSPMPHRGSPNEPARVPLVGAAVAAARGVRPETVAATTRANARRLFGLDAP